MLAFEKYRTATATTSDSSHQLIFIFDEVSIPKYGPPCKINCSEIGYNKFIGISIYERLISDL